MLVTVVKTSKQNIGSCFCKVGVLQHNCHITVPTFSTHTHRLSPILWVAKLGEAFGQLWLNEVLA